MTRFSLAATFAAVLLFSNNVPAQTGTQNESTTTPAAAPGSAAAPATGGDPFAKFQKFSAVLNGGLGRDTNRKIYRDGNLMRFDFDDHYRVVDLKTRTLYAVYPHGCSRFPMMDPGVFPFSRKFRVESSSLEGTDSVNGHACRIQNMVVVSAEPVLTKFNMKACQAEDLNGFPLRINVENPLSKAKFTITYSDVSLDPPDPKLFSHPAKCNTNAALQPSASPVVPGSKPAVRSTPKAAAKPAPDPK